MSRAPTPKQPVAGVEGRGEQRSAGLPRGEGEMRGPATAWAVLTSCLRRPAAAWREHLVRDLCVPGAWPCPRGGSALGLSGHIWSGHKKHARPGSQSFAHPLAAAAVGSGFGLDRLGPGSWLIILLLPHLFVCSEMSSEMCRLLVVCVLSRPCESDRAKGLIWSYFVSFQILIYSLPPCLPLI